MTSGGMTGNQVGGINFLYTNIGRGHPFYLDGITECMPPDRVGDVTDVFAGTTGLARGAWRLARLVYSTAGAGGPYSSLYNRLRSRSDYNRRGLFRGMMGRQLRTRFLEDPRPLVVGHHFLVAILKDKPGLVYQHGEVTAPEESWVRGRHRVLVPLAETADRLIAAGFSAGNIFVSGLCIEPRLVAQAEKAYGARLARLARPGPLCGVFFSSGAEPREHVEKLAIAALSASADGGCVIVVARRSGRLAARVAARFAADGRDLVMLRSLQNLPVPERQDLLCLYDDRRQLNEFTARLFERFDYFVAPSHERTNWALGLGLPLFIVEPSLGSFAPLNREFLLRASVAGILEDRRGALRFGGTVGELHAAGELTRMAEAGWGRFETRGFVNIAEFLQSL
jgi:hypothetical protein